MQRYTKTYYFYTQFVNIHIIERAEAFQFSFLSLLLVDMESQTLFPIQLHRDFFVMIFSIVHYVLRAMIRQASLSFCFLHTFDKSVYLSVWSKVRSFPAIYLSCVFSLSLPFLSVPIDCFCLSIHIRCFTCRQKNCLPPKCPSK